LITKNSFFEKHACEKKIGVSGREGQRKIIILRRRLISSRLRLTYKNRRESKMVNYCPECGGEIQYISLTKHYVCKSCGLSCTGQELNDLHDKNRPAEETEEEQRQNRRKEYLKWYLSSKKK